MGRPTKLFKELEKEYVIHLFGIHAFRSGRIEEGVLYKALLGDGFHEETVVENATGIVREVTSKKGIRYELLVGDRYVYYPEGVRHFIGETENAVNIDETQAEQIQKNIKKRMAK